MSGCPIAAMGKLVSTTTNQAKKTGLHLVLLPKEDDPSKAVLAACNEKELIRLAAQKSQSVSPTGPASESDRILRPMILTKQLELQGTDSVVSTSTPRGNLAKELEKYSRPDLNKVHDQQGTSATTPVQKPPPKKDLSERPNILRRPSFKPKLARSPSSSSESSITLPLNQPVSSTSSTISNILSQQKQANIEYTRSVTTVTIPNPIMANKSSIQPQIHGSVLTSQQNIASKAKTIYLQSGSQTYKLPPGYIILPQ